MCIKIRNPWIIPIFRCSVFLCFYTFLCFCAGTGIFLFLCFVCIFCLYILFVYFVCMFCLYVLFVCFVCMFCLISWSPHCVWGLVGVHGQCQKQVMSGVDKNQNVVWLLKNIKWAKTPMGKNTNGHKRSLMYINVLFIL